MKTCAILTLALMLPLSTVLADTNVPAGNVSGSWTAAGSPYLIDGDTAIQVGDELVIEAGCRIEFTGHYDLHVFGRLVATGTETENIEFDASAPIPGWHGIRFVDTTTNGQNASEFTYCVFRNGRAVGSGTDLDGGAMHCTGSADIVVSHCTFVDNFSDRFGGAINLNAGSDISIDNTDFIDNEAYFRGGAINCDESSPVIVDSLLDSNHSTVFAGGISGEYGSDFRLENVRILNSTAGTVAGFYIIDSEVVMVGCLVTGSVSTLGSGGGGGVTSGGHLRLINSTVADNQCALLGGGVWVYTSSIEVVNSIIWANSPDPIALLEGSTAAVSYSDITGGWSGSGNIAFDPPFMGVGDHPYALSELSPCIDAGNPDPFGLDLPDLDLAGNPRIGGERVDMGAYENADISDVPLAQATMLGTIFPNPFNPQTAISFTADHPQHVVLTVYDLSGRRLAVLADEAFAAGDHTVNWDGRDANGTAMPSGTYLARMDTEAGVQAKKMMLIR